MILKLKKIKALPLWKSYFLTDVDIEDVLVFNKISFGEKDNLLVTCMLIKKLSHYK